MLTRRKLSLKDITPARHKKALRGFFISYEFFKDADNKYIMIINYFKG